MKNSNSVSTCPAGESFPLPDASAYQTENQRLADLSTACQGADAVILAARHQAYRDLDPAALVDMIGQPAAIIDCFGLLSDAQIRQYFELGCEVKGLGRGHVKRIKDMTLKS